jgi:tripartite-type tricarboxylate transporter receptor subunit TctC
MGSLWEEELMSIASPLQRLLAAALVSTALLSAAQAQDASSSANSANYPNRRISFVVPLPPGGSSDPLARIIADRLTPRLGQAVIIDNKPGAGGFIGSDFVSKAPPDGYTIMISTQVLVAPPEMRAIKDFDPLKLASLGRIAGSPFLIVIPAETSPRTLQEFVAEARANPGKLNYGVVAGSSMQLDMIQLGQAVKASLTEVPFNGSAPIAAALLGNQIQMSFLSVTAIPHIQSGKIRALAVTSKNRWSRMPDVPSMGDLGIDFESGFWFGMNVPAGTPQPIRDRLTRELVEVMKLEDVRAAVVKLGMEPMEPSPAEMDEHLRRERVRNEAAYRLLKPAK